MASNNTAVILDPDRVKHLQNKSKDQQTEIQKFCARADELVKYFSRKIGETMTDPAVLKFYETNLVSLTESLHEINSEYNLLIATYQELGDINGVQRAQSEKDYLMEDYQSKYDRFESHFHQCNQANKSSPEQTSTLADPNDTVIVDKATNPPLLIPVTISEQRKVEIQNKLAEGGKQIMSKWNKIRMHLNQLKSFQFSPEEYKERHIGVASLVEALDNEYKDRKDMYLKLGDQNGASACDAKRQDMLAEFDPQIKSLIQNIANLHESDSDSASVTSTQMGLNKDLDYTKPVDENTITDLQFQNMSMSGYNDTLYLPSNNEQYTVVSSSAPISTLPPGSQILLPSTVGDQFSSTRISGHSQVIPQGNIISTPVAVGGAIPKRRITIVSPGQPPVAPVQISKPVPVSMQPQIVASNQSTSVPVSLIPSLACPPPSLPPQQTLTTSTIYSSTAAAVRVANPVPDTLSNTIRNAYASHAQLRNPPQQPYIPQPSVPQPQPQAFTQPLNATSHYQSINASDPFYFPTSSAPQAQQYYPSQSYIPNFSMHLQNPKYSQPPPNQTLHQSNVTSNSNCSHSCNIF